MARRKTTVEEFDPARVRPLPGQPRKRFRGIRELADSIAEVGQQTPGIVTPVEDDPKFDVQLVDGERRLRACKAAGVTFRAEVRAGGDIEEIFAASFAANFGRQDHDAVEIAESLARMQRAGKTIEQMGRIAGRSECWVSQHLNLLKLHPDVLAMMVKPEDAGDDDAPKITFAVAQMLARIPQDHQVQIAAKIANDGMGLTEASRYVLRKRAALGDKDAYSAGRAHGKRRNLASLLSLSRDYRNRVGVYLDMKQKDFTALANRSGRKEVAQVIEALEATAQDLADLREALEELMNAAKAKAEHSS